ncbi:MAG TPA: hypothetical protein VGB42_05410 [Candidatus Thermoplasmatota archaeon]
MAHPPPTAAPRDDPPRPTRRLPAAALLVGSAAAMAALLVVDLYRALPPELLAPLASFGPPARVLLVVAVLAEGVAAAFLVVSGRHPLDAPIITHYGTRTLAAGGVVAALGVVALVVWSSAARFFLVENAFLMEAAVVATLCGAALLLSALAVLASAIVAPWVVAPRG